MDLKAPGLRARGDRGDPSSAASAERTLISSQYDESLALVGELAPGMRRGWSVPRVRRDYTRSLLAPVAYGRCASGRGGCPRRPAAMLESGRGRPSCPTSCSCHPRSSTPCTAPAGSSTSGPSTTPKKIAWFEAIGADGVITNDPRLFGVRPGYGVGSTAFGATGAGGPWMRQRAAE